MSDFEAIKAYRQNYDGEAMRDPSGPAQFNLDGWISEGPFEKLCGMEIIQAKEGKALVSMPYRVKLSMGGGLMHGGALVSLAETAIAMAVKSLLPEGSTFVTLSLNSTFIAPMREGTAFAKAEVERSEGKKLHASARIFNEHEEHVADFNALFIVTDK
mgnify:CR=1 FL=1